MEVPFTLSTKRTAAEADDDVPSHVSNNDKRKTVERRMVVVRERERHPEDPSAVDEVVVFIVSMVDMIESESVVCSIFLCAVLSVLAADGKRISKK
jgi:hypothetical protein